MAAHTVGHTRHHFKSAILEIRFADHIRRADGTTCNSRLVGGGFGMVVQGVRQPLFSCFEAQHTLGKDQILVTLGIGHLMARADTGDAPPELGVEGRYLAEIDSLTSSPTSRQNFVLSAPDKLERKGIPTAVS